MDYEFRRSLTGDIIAQFSMGHEAIGYWLNEEVKTDLALISHIEQHAQQPNTTEKEWLMAGHEYSLIITADEVIIRANQLNFSQDELQDDMHYYDQESVALCGLTDFLLMLEQYRQFINDKR